MDDRVRFVIPTAHLGGLGRCAGAAPTPVSPFRSGADRPMPAEVAQELRRQEVLDAQGRIVGRCAPTCGVLAATPAFARFRYAMGPVPFEALMYFAPDASHAVSLTIRGPEATVEDPAPTEELLEGIRHLTGGSARLGTAFEAETSAEEAIALAALLDLRRRALLLALLGGRDVDEQPYYPEVLSRSIAEPKVGAQWFLTHVKSMLPATTSLDPATLGRSLESLAAPGLVVREAPRYRLGEACRTLADRMCLVEGVVEFLAGRAGPDGQVHSVGFTVLQAGVADLVMLDSVANRMKISTLSAEQLHGTIRHFFENPNAIELPVASAPPPMEVTTLYCPGCGRSVKPEDKFCRKCGKPLR